MLKTKLKCAFVFSVLLAFSVLKGSATAPDTLFIKPSLHSHGINKYYRYYKDNQNGGVKEALSALSKNLFKQNNTNGVLNEPISSAPYWIVLYVKNDTTVDFPIIWNFNEDGIQFTLFDITDTARPVLIDSNSTALEMGNRSFNCRRVSFNVFLPAGQFKKLMVKCNITTANQMFVPTSVFTLNDLFMYETNYSFLLGRYFGFFLFALLLNLLLWIFSRNKLYCFQFLYIFSLIIFNVIEQMFDGMLLPAWLHQVVMVMPKISFYVLSLFFATYVFEAFTEHKRYFPKANKWLNIFRILILFNYVLLFATLFYNKYPVTWLLILRDKGTLLALINYLVFILFIVYGSIKKDRLHLIYLLSASPILLGFLNFIANGLFDIDLFGVEPSNIVVGLAIELLLQTIIFSNRYKFLNEKVVTLAEEKLEVEKNVTHEVMQAQEMERVKISEDLHDHLGNDFLGLQMLTERLVQINRDRGYPIDTELLSQIKGEINSMAADMRYITHALSQKYIVEEGLIALVEQRIALLNSGGAIKFLFEHRGNPELLSTMSNITIFRIILESINNIIKHSDASEATIQLLVDDHTISIIAKDNGKGFDRETVKNGLGLFTIQARAEGMKGKLEINTAIGKGCTLAITIPTEYHKNK